MWVNSLRHSGPIYEKCKMNYYMQLKWCKSHDFPKLFIDDKDTHNNNSAIKCLDKEREIKNSRIILACQSMSQLEIG